MPINQLVTFCRDSIVKHGKCVTCAYECDNLCINCLQDSHFDSARTYDCQNMIYCYTSCYVYKYASEITHLFNYLRYTSFQQFNVLNLGCGSCADLFGINRYLTLANRVLPVKYTGVDINERWYETQRKIVQIFSTNPNYSISFINSDVFDFLDSIEPNKKSENNIVILQYIVNELNKHCSDRMNEFVVKFVEKIINVLPDNSTVIINDINHYNVRQWFNKIFIESQKTNVVSVIRKRFIEPVNVPILDYEPYVNCDLIFDVLDFGQKIKSPCSSAQFILYKTKDK